MNGQIGERNAVAGLELRLAAPAAPCSTAEKSTSTAWKTCGIVRHDSASRSAGLAADVVEGDVLAGASPDCGARASPPPCGEGLGEG